MKKIILFFAIIGFTLPSIGQEANTNQPLIGIPQPKNPDVEAMMNAAAKLLSDPIGYEMSYQIIHNDKVNKKSSSTRGTATIKGNKFYLFTPELEAWYNGETQWMYYRANKEVNISSPTESELSTLNPLFIAENYKQFYTCEYIRYAYSSEQEQYVHCLRLVPKDKDSNLKMINFNVLDKTFAPFLVVYNEKNGSKTEISVTKFSQKQKVSDLIFTFDPKKYENVEIIDLR